uniref:Uncharacterized protein n=1 Tax=Pseudomonas phage HRDY3 TaxID=3236930 RepID=A0AB39CDI0_9VIRU
MITIHLYLPGSPNDLDHGAYALSDGEAISLPARYYAPEADVTLHLANEIAFDAFRLAVAQGHIEPTNIRWRVHSATEIFRGTINRFGVPCNEDGKQWQPWKSPGDHQVEEIMMAAYHKKKRERQDQPNGLLRLLSFGRDKNCKSNGESEDGSSPVN